MKRLISIGTAALLLCTALASLGAQEVGKELRPGHKKELIRLKYLEASQVDRLVRPYLSREGFISADPRGEKLMVVSDFPEFVDKVLAVIKEIDVKPADILITAQLVVGSSAGGEKNDEALQNDPVIKEIRGFLPYRNFALLDANMIRAIDNARTQMTLGKNAEFVLELRPKHTKDGEAEYIQTELRLMLIHKPESIAVVEGKDTIPPGQGRSQSLIQTELNFKSGEKTVVGVSKLDGGDKGLVLILSAKVVR